MQSGIAPLNAVLTLPAGKLARSAQLTIPFTEKDFAAEKVSVLDVVEICKASKASSATNWGPQIGVALLVIGLYFVWRSFYAMRIPKKAPTSTAKGH